MLVCVCVCLFVCLFVCCLLLVVWLLFVVCCLLLFMAVVCDGNLISTYHKRNEYNHLWLSGIVERNQHKYTCSLGVPPAKLIVPLCTATSLHQSFQSSSISRVCDFHLVAYLVATPLFGRDPSRHLCWSAARVYRRSAASICFKQYVEV